MQGPPAGPEKPAMHRQTALPAGAEVLPEHAMHTDADNAPITDEKVLGGQLTHATTSVALEYLPAKHF